MICTPCRKQQHAQCDSIRGEWPNFAEERTWCDCQHKEIGLADQIRRAFEYMRRKYGPGALDTENEA